MPSLFEYANWVRQLRREQFASKYAHPFLLRTAESDAAESNWGFNTRTFSPEVMAKAISEDVKPLPSELGDYDVIAVLKALHNPWPDRISVGRAHNNDVVLPDHSISKLHAHFLPQSNGTMLLTDVGSSNGTRVNSSTVAQEPMPIQSGDAVTFGAVTLTFLDAGGLYDVVAKILAVGAQDR